MIARFAVKRICKRSPDTSLPIHCVRGLSHVCTITHCGMPNGYSRDTRWRLVCRHRQQAGSYRVRGQQVERFIGAKKTRNRV